MKRQNLVIATAWLLHTASWFLPAMRTFLGGSLDFGIPGWSVFLAETIASILPQENGSRSVKPLSLVAA